jgi:hypothetical protein
MASRQSTSKARPGRSRASPSRRTRSTRPKRKRRVEKPEPQAFGPLREAIEHERGELTRAQSVLGCLAFALLYSDWITEDPPDYAGVAEMARKIVSDSVDRLDSVYVGPLIKRIWKAQDQVSQQKQPKKKTAAGRQGQPS